MLKGVAFNTYLALFDPLSLNPPKKEPFEVKDYRFKSPTQTQTFLKMELLNLEKDICILFGDIKRKVFESLLQFLANQINVLLLRQIL